jgi:tetratricopeptide (TPR) repeat protein
MRAGYMIKNCGLKVLHSALCVVFLFSCSLIQKEEKKEVVPEVAPKKVLTQQEIEQQNEKSLEDVSQRLKKLSVAAKNSGDSAVTFLASDMFLKANAAQLQGDYVTANFLYKHLVELVPDDPFIKKKFAISLIKSGELVEAEKVLSDIHKNSKKKDEKIALILAGVKSGLGQVKEAKKIYRQVLKDNPKSKDACIFLAKVHSIEENYDSAIKVLKNCQRKMKKEGIISYYVGKIYLDKGDLKRSLTYFEKAYKIDPSLSEAVVASGVLYEEKGQVKRAIKLYKKHLKEYPADEAVLNRVVQVLFSEEDYETVIPYAERLSDLEPDNLNLKVKLGILYSDTRKFEKAISVFKELLDYAPDSDRILYYLAAIYQEVDDYNNSIEYFNKIMPESALYHDSVLQISHMLNTLAQNSKQDKKEEANQRFLVYIDAKLDEIGELRVELSSIKAAHQENNMDYDGAIVSMEDVMDRDEFTTSHSYYLASLYEKIQKYDEAEALMRDVLKEDPKDAHAWNFLGYSYLERGIKMEEAEEYIKKAVQLEPKDGYIRDSLGWFYFRTGQYNKALKELKIAVKNTPGDRVITKHLAQIYQALKKFNKAKKYYNEALKYCKDDTERQEIQKELKSLESERLPAAKKK